MKFLTSLPALFLAAALTPAGAAVPPPEQLLPDDTLMVLTVPDAMKGRTFLQGTPMASLWNSAEMKPFHDKFMDKLQSDVLGPIEQELGIELKDYLALARGQVTLALTLNGSDAQPGKEPGLMLLIDTTDKAADAATLLTDLKKRWVDAGRPLKNTQVRDVEFTTIEIDRKAIQDALGKTFATPPGSAKPPGEEEADAKKLRLTIGLSQSLLMIGSEPAVFEKVLVRLAGGSLPAIAEKAVFQSAHHAHFRDAAGYFWLDTKTVFGIATKQLAKESAGESPQNPMAVSPGNAIKALGFESLESLGLYAVGQPEGQLMGMFVRVPESARRGLFKIFAPEAKDASPPNFIPADTTQFFRWRLDFQQAWKGLETLVVEVFPPAQALLGMIIENAGKDSDPNFNLRKMVIGNIGDDIITFAKAPRAATMEAISAAPSLTLLGSPQAEQLVGAMRTGLSFLMPPGAEGAAQDREFLGRKVYALPMPGLPGQMTSTPKMLSYTASGSYVAFSADAPLLEEYLRGPEAQGRPLRELPGLNEAAQKVGGMNTGMFGYENPSESFRLVYETVRKDPDAFEKLFQGPLGTSPISPEMRQNREAWFDFKLLPAWEAVARYFHWTVYAGSATTDGLHFKAFAPTPPALR